MDWDNISTTRSKMILREMTAEEAETHLDFNRALGPPTNLQDIFTRQWDWFITQNHPLAFEEKEGCCYRKMYDPPSGPPVPMCCSLGCLLPPEIYYSAWERTAIGNLLQKNVPGLQALMMWFEEIPLAKLIRLQSIHDGASTRAAWREAMIEFAETNGLSYATL